MNLRRRIEQLEQRAATRDEAPVFRPLTDDEIASGDYVPFPAWRLPAGDASNEVVLMFPRGTIPSPPRADDGPVGRADERGG